MPPVIKFVFVALATLALIACEQGPREASQAPRQPEERRLTAPAENPLLERYLTPFGTPPFHRLDASHLLPALEQAIEQHREAVAAIVDNDEGASFTNTIEALENADHELSRVIGAFYGLINVTDDHELHEIAPEFSANVTAHRHAVLFNRDLFRRIESVHEQLDALPLESEQRRLTEITHRRFMHAGAGLPESKQQRLHDIDRLLAEHSSKLDLGLRELSGDFELRIEDEALLQGLPEALLNLAARTARQHDQTSGWAFPLHKHSLYPFLTHFPERGQRQAMYEAWIERLGSEQARRSGTAGIIGEMAQLRAERAELLGFDSHLDYELAGSSIGSADQLRDLMDTLASAARDRVVEELGLLGSLARRDGLNEELQPWDWWYYAQRLRASELEQAEAELRDWFSLEQARDGAFALANRLWGLSFHVRTDIPLWNTDVETHEVRDAAGEHLGIIFLDHLYREGKRAGAWTSIYRPPSRDEGERVAPIVANVTNFPPPAAGLPSLLSPEELQILFRQFGHAMSELLSDVPYSSLTGSVASTEFARFPAQLMQLWAMQPEVLRMYAYHHETGGMITDQAIAALAGRQRLLAGIETMQQIAAIEVDLALHGVGSGKVPTLQAAVSEVQHRLELPAVISPHQHADGLGNLFVTRHEGSHYQTLWAEMLAADAFAAFEDATILDRSLAQSLREEILAPGNSRDPMKSWRALRNRDPQLEHLLNARGLGD